MMRVVIDTNVVVSANLVDAGPPAAIFLLAINSRLIQMCISPAVFAEYEEVLRRPRFKFSASKIDHTLDLIRRTGRMVRPSSTLNISDHDSDNRFYECALEAAADYLITGNIGDFPRDLGPTKIITPRSFLDEIVPQLLHGDL